MGRWGDGEMGEMGRWGDGEMGRWGDGEMGENNNSPVNSQQSTVNSQHSNDQCTLLPKSSQAYLIFFSNPIVHCANAQLLKKFVTTALDNCKNVNVKTQFLCGKNHYQYLAGVSMGV
jgi:hypothetical protein